MVHAIHSATSFLFVCPREIQQTLTGINPGWQLPASLRSRDTSCRSLVTLYDEKSMGGKKKIPLSSSCTANVDRNGRSQALNDSLRWHPALAYQIKLTPSCPWVQGKGRHVGIFMQGRGRDPCMDGTPQSSLFPHKDISKPLGCCKTAKPSWHQIRRRKTMSAPFAGYFHLFSLKWKWDGSSVSLSKRCACIQGTHSVKTSNVFHPLKWLCYTMNSAWLSAPPATIWLQSIKKVCPQWKNRHSRCFISFAVTE